MRRRMKRFAIVLVALAAILAVAARFALRSAYAARKVAAELSTALGADVRVGAADLGWWGTKLENVEMGEGAWAAVGDVDAALTLSQVVVGDMAGGVVTMRGAAVTLRFDEMNRLLTRLPKPPDGPAVPLPTLRIENGTLTFAQVGKPDEVFRGINAELRDDGQRCAVSGSIDDPDWGAWTFAGGRETLAAPFEITLKSSAAVRATPELLKRVPFVKLTVWDAVTLDGLTPVRVVVRFLPEGVRHRVELAPIKTRVRVPSIDMTAENAGGEVTIEDGLLTLRDVRGDAANGRLTVGSVMDFRDKTKSVLKFTIEAETLNPALLPPSWNVPALGVGKVSGKANLEVVNRVGAPTTTTGSGEGSVILPLLRPIRIALVADGRGFRFVRPQ